MSTCDDMMTKDERCDHLSRRQYEVSYVYKRSDIVSLLTRIIDVCQDFAGHYNSTIYAFEHDVEVILRRHPHLLLLISMDVS